MTDPKRMFPGYGRGWGEEKATTPIARFLQFMREPATTKSWVVMTIFCFLLPLAFIVLIVRGGE